MVVRIAILASLPGLFFTSGCATYARTSLSLRQSLLAGDYVEAANVIRGHRRGPDRLLYLLENGLMAHQEGAYHRSNLLFEAAERLSDRLFARSVTRELTSLLTNDAIRSYRGEAFELIFINYYRALNYWYLGETEDALVECRKANLKLARYASLDGGNTRYTNDAFIHYLTGLFYEAAGEWNDARVSYSAAVDAYRTQGPTLGLTQPPALHRDLHRVDAMLGGNDPGRSIGGREAETADRLSVGAGEIVLLTEIGFISPKTHEAVELPIYSNDVKSAARDRLDPIARRIARRRSHHRHGNSVKYWLRATIPVYAGQPRPIRTVRLASAGQAARSHKVQDLSRVARATFTNRQETILARTVARGLAKYLVTQKIRKQNKVLGFLANLFAASTETADTRCWSTLPHEIQVTRLRLPEGVHDLEVEVVDKQGRVLERKTIESVRIRPGRRTFLNLRTYS